MLRNVQIFIIQQCQIDLQDLIILLKEVVLFIKRKIKSGVPFNTNKIKIITFLILKN